MDMDEEAAGGLGNDAPTASAPLLEKYEQECHGAQQHELKHRSVSQQIWRALTIVTLLALFYALGFLTANRTVHPRGLYSGATYSPASEAISFRRVSYNGQLSAGNAFRGEPRPELDDAWHDLLEHHNIRLSTEELRRMNQTAIKLHDGSGFYGQLSVFHHLHCLKLMRQLLHPQYYHVEFPDRDVHVDHCIDGLRQALMCHPDISVVTSHWKPNYRRPWPNFMVDQTCVDWDALDSWAGQRSFSVFDQKSLVHPEMGIVFPLINGTIEQAAHGPDIHIVWPDDHR